MRIWTGHGSEHSMDLVMIGHFKEEPDAERAKEIIDRLTAQVNKEVEVGNLRVGKFQERYSDEMLEVLEKLRTHDLAPDEMEQFTYDVDVKVSGKQIVLTTEESAVQAFLKVMLHQGAKVEVFSGHDYPEDKERHR